MKGKTLQGAGALVCRCEPTSIALLWSPLSSNAVEEVKPKNKHNHDNKQSKIKIKRGDINIFRPVARNMYLLFQKRAVCAQMLH